MNYNLQNIMSYLLCVLPSYTMTDGMSLMKALTRLPSRLVPIKIKPFIKLAITHDNTCMDDYYHDGDLIRLYEFKPIEYVFRSSGKLVVENDLREYFDTILIPHNDTITKRISRFKHHLSQGFMFGYVGNTSPNLLLSYDKTKLYISNSDSHLNTSHQHICSINTNLWNYSMVDYDVFFTKNPTLNPCDFNIIEIPSGLWKYTHQYRISIFNESDYFAKLEKLG